MNSFIDNILSMHFNDRQAMHPRKPGIFEISIPPVSPVNFQQIQSPENIYAIPNPTYINSEGLSSNKNKTDNSFQNNLHKEKYASIKEKSFTDKIITGNKKTLETSVKNSDSIQNLKNTNSTIDKIQDNIGDKQKNTVYTNLEERIKEPGLTIKTNHPIQSKTILPDKIFNQPLFINNKLKNEAFGNIANPIKNQFQNKQNHTIIKVSIGSIEVRTNNLSASPDKKSKPAEIKRMSLDEYLQKRNTD